MKKTTTPDPLATLPTRQFVLVKVNAFLARHPDISKDRFGRETVNDHNFLNRLADTNIGITLTNIEKVEKFMTERDAVADGQRRVAAAGQTG